MNADDLSLKNYTKLKIFCRKQIRITNIEQTNKLSNRNVTNQFKRIFQICMYEKLNLKF